MHTYSDFGVYLHQGSPCDRGCNGLVCGRFFPGLRKNLKSRTFRSFCPLFERADCTAVKTAKAKEEDRTKIDPLEKFPTCPPKRGRSRITDGSASAFPFSRPTRRSLTLRPAYSSSHQVALCTGELSSRLTPWAAAPITTGWSDICRAGFAPAERPCLCTAHGRNRGNLNGRSEKLKKDQLLANQFDSNPGSHFILYFNSVRLISHLDSRRL